MASTKPKTIIPMAEHFPGRVSWKANLTKIVQKFDAMDLMDRALKTQFQYLFRAPDVLFSGTIVHQMLLRKSSSNSKETKFLVNGEEACFGMKEYAMVTGLNFGRFPPVKNMERGDKECLSLVDKYFNSNITVRVADLESNFLSCSDKEDAWKMGLVCLVCQYLFALDPRRIVNIKILRMVEDIDTFLQFPWGKVSFIATLKGVNKDMKHLRSVYLANEGKKNRRAWDVSYTIYGFTLAFQVWTYEVIKTFVPKFAYRTKLHEPFCPRILLYKSNRRNSIQDVISALKGKVVTTMKESEEEKILYGGVDFEEMEGNIFDETFEVNRKRKYKDVVPVKRAKMKQLTIPSLNTTHPTATPTSSDTSSSRPVHDRVPPTSGDSSSTAPVQDPVTPTAPETDAYYAVGRKLDELTEDVKEIKTEIKLIKENQLLQSNQIAILLTKLQEQKKSEVEEEQEDEEDVALPCNHVFCDEPRDQNADSNTSSRAKEWVFCGSALSDEDQLLMVKFARTCGAKVSELWGQNVTHVIAATDANGACRRTLKVLKAILNGRWVLEVDWIKDSMKAKSAINEEPYEVQLDNHGCHGGPRAGRLRTMNNLPALFDSCRFHFIGDFIPACKRDLTELVMAGGGTVKETKEEFVQAVASVDRSIIVYDSDSSDGEVMAEELATEIVGSEAVAYTWLLESIAADSFTWLLESIDACQRKHVD